MTYTHERLASHVRLVESGCWEWTGARRKDGYGIAGTRPAQYAHRVSYVLFVGPIPDGLQIDHLCRNRGCVNPAHLEPVTARENTRRGLAGQVTHCPEGHSYDAANTYRRPGGGRMCRECGRRRHRDYERTLQLSKPRAIRTHCAHGHPFDEPNTYVTTTGTRQCRTCHASRERVRRAA